jgi:hypothetical protein
VGRIEFGQTWLVVEGNLSVEMEDMQYHFIPGQQTLFFPCTIFTSRIGKLVYSKKLLHRVHVG